MKQSPLFSHTQPISASFEWAQDERRKGETKKAQACFSALPGHIAAMTDWRKTDWPIAPLISAGPLKFGMTPSEVAVILGPPEPVRFSADPAGSGYEEYRIFDDVQTMPPILQYEYGKLASADFDRNLKRLKLGQLNLHRTARVKLIPQLIEMSRAVFETFDGYIFTDLGISLSDVGNARTNPSINIFGEGVFDSYIADTLAEGDPEMGRWLKAPG